MENELETVIQLMDRTPGHRRSIADAPAHRSATAPMRSRLAHPASGRPAPARPARLRSVDDRDIVLDLDAATLDRPALRLAFSNGRRVQPVGA